MTVTAEQLQDAVDAARRMKNALDSHLGVLRAKVKRASEEGKQIPSQNNFFIYMQKSNGLITIQQDAAFIVEAVLVLEPAGTNTGPVLPIPSPLFYELALKDANAGRDLTGGFHPVYDAPATGTPALPEEDSNFVPGRLFVPISGVLPVASYDIPNVDDWKTTKAEYILPRRSVVRPVFRSSGTFGSGTPDVPNPKVALLGYKIF